MVAGAAPGEGSRRDADRKQQIGLCHSSGLGIQGGGRKREVGKGGCYGGCPEERRLCPLKIIIDPHRDERLVCECCFAFTVYKALEHVFFSFVLNGNLGRHSGRLGVGVPIYN